MTRPTHFMLPLATALTVIAGCGGPGLPDGWQDAAETCSNVFVLDQVIQANGEGYIPERVAQGVQMLPVSARAAAAASPEYEQLNTLVGNFMFAIDNNDPSAVLDFVAIEGECDQLGFGMSPPS